MRFRLVFLITVVAVAATAQTRSILADAAAVRLEAVRLSPLPDGGCSLMVCGALDVDDATRLATCETVELATTTNRSRCAALVDAARLRWLKRAGFPVDAGVP